MHKLRNTKHKEILERIFDIIPSGYNELPFKKFKKRTRMFCALYKWDETKIRKLIENGDWSYCYIFFND